MIDGQSVRAADHCRGRHVPAVGAGARNASTLVRRPARHEMRRSDDGWFKLHVAGRAAPARAIKFRIDGEIEVPDPASHFQPDDVHGPSEVIDHGATIGRPRTGRAGHGTNASFLELHVGTFTPQGTFRAVIDKLDHLATTGITAIELMPVADFSGPLELGL